MLAQENFLSIQHQALASSQTEIKAPKLSEKHLLFICESSDQFKRFDSQLNLDQINVTVATSFEDFDKICEETHDLVILDLQSEKLITALSMLRKSPQHIDVPILVNRTTSIVDRSMAGILPLYRAMPGSLSEIVLLAHRSLNPVYSPEINKSHRIIEY